jgi:hypothetical protein
MKNKIKKGVKGLLQKSNQDSFFIMVNGGSLKYNDIFTDKPTYENYKVEVLQIMIINEQWLIVELLKVE